MQFLIKMKVFFVQQGGFQETKEDLFEAKQLFYMAIKLCLQIFILSFSLLQQLRQYFQHYTLSILVIRFTSTSKYNTIYIIRGNSKTTCTISQNNNPIMILDLRTSHVFQSVNKKISFSIVFLYSGRISCKYY